MPSRCHTTCAPSREHEYTPPDQPTSSTSSSATRPHSGIPTTRHHNCFQVLQALELTRCSTRVHRSQPETHPNHEENTIGLHGNCTATWNKLHHQAQLAPLPGRLLRYHDTRIWCFPVATEAQPNGFKSLKSVHKSQITTVYTVHCVEVNEHSTADCQNVCTCNKKTKKTTRETILFVCENASAKMREALTLLLNRFSPFGSSYQTIPPPTCQIPKCLLNLDRRRPNILA